MQKCKNCSRVCISLCTTVVHNSAQSNSDHRLSKLHVPGWRLYNNLTTWLSSVSTSSQWFHKDKRFVSNKFMLLLFS